MWAEIVRRLQGQAKLRGEFVGVHVCPESSADIPDLDEARLVIVHPKIAKAKSDDAAKDFALKATQHRGTANRTHRNMLVFLCADEQRLEELDHATRDYLGWSHVIAQEADLDLTANQRNQAAHRRAQADQTVNARLLQTFMWALVPTQPDPAVPFEIKELKVEGSSDSLADRVSRRLGSDGNLSTRQAAATVRLAIDKVPAIWKDGHVSLGTLWGLYSQYPYMPRLRDRRVLDDGIDHMPLLWQTDGFALATGYDAAAQRYTGLWTPDQNGGAPPLSDSLLLVRPDVAVAQRQAEHQRTPTYEQGLVKATASMATPGAAATVDVFYPRPKVRFFGTKTLNPDKGRDAGTGDSFGLGRGCGLGGDLVLVLDGRQPGE